MRAVVFCLLALVAAAAARELNQVTALNCQTESSATLNLQGSGTGVAQSKAFCEAEADAEKVIREVVKKYIEVFDGDDSKGQCTEAKASEVVTGVAKAIASVYTSVTTKVEITGTGEACASGFAAGDSLAVSVVNIYLGLTVELIEEKYPDRMYGQDVKRAVDDKYPPEKTDSATGEASGSAIAAAIATAWAAASSDACTKGGFEADFEEAFVKSTTVAVAELWATVIVELCSNFDDADSEGLKEWAEETSSSFSEIGGEVDVTGTVETSMTAGGTASGTADEIPPCTGGKGVCCSSNSLSQNTCSCGSGCTMTKGSQSKGQGVWEDGAGVLCFCA